MSHQSPERQASSAKSTSTSASPARRTRASSSPREVLQRAQVDPGSLTPADVLQLQRTIGNRATGRLLAQQLSVQAKLQLGPANDKYEQEADDVARQVVRRMAAPASPVQRDEESGEQTQAWPRYDTSAYTTTPASQPVSVKRTFVAPQVQRAEMDEELAQASPLHGLEGGDVDSSVAETIQRAKGSGNALDPKTRAGMEGAIGASFGGVRVHTNGQADMLNRSLNARAFTTGRDIFFRRGEYNPGSSGGKELLAHELTHTVQQSGTEVQRAILDPDYEDEVFEIEQAKREARVLDMQGGKIAENDPRKQILNQELFASPKNAEEIHKREIAERGKPGKLDKDDPRKRMLSQMFSAPEFAGTAGKRETETAKRSELGEGKEAATNTMQDILWARSLSGGDQAKATLLLALAHAIPGLEFRVFVLGIVGDKKKLDFAKKQAQNFSAPFSADEFNLFYAVPKEIATFKKLFTQGAPWTAGEITIFRNVTAKKLLTESQQKTILESAATHNWNSLDLTALLSKLNKPAAVALTNTASLQTEVEAGKTAGWTMADIGTVIEALWSKKITVVPLEKFLKHCRDSAYSGANTKLLIAGLTAEILTGIANTNTLKASLKDIKGSWTNYAKLAALLKAFYTKKPDFGIMAKFLKHCHDSDYTEDNGNLLIAGLTAEILTGIANTNTLKASLKDIKGNWTDYTKLAALLRAFYTKKPDFGIMANFLKPCKTHNWTQDNVKDLVNNVQGPVLEQIADTTTLQTQIQAVSATWTDWKKMGQTLQEGESKNMTATDKANLLEECTSQTYTAENAKKYIMTASVAGGYTWTTRLDQVKKFRGHAQPGGATNGFGGGWTDVRWIYTWNGNYQADINVGVPGDKITHVKDGHSYENYYFSNGNCYRSAASSMFAPGTDIAAKCSTAAGNSDAKIKNAAFGGGGTQDTSRANYVVAFANDGIDRSTNPWIYYAALSQLYPKGGWVHHELKADLAAGIGKLKGYMA